MRFHKKMSRIGGVNNNGQDETRMDLIHLSHEEESWIRRLCPLTEKMPPLISPIPIPPIRPTMSCVYLLASLTMFSSPTLPTVPFFSSYFMSTDVVVYLYFLIEIYRQMSVCATTDIMRTSNGHSSQSKVRRQRFTVAQRKHR